MATISLRASRQGDRVIIEVEDDGRGIDVARVREVARQRDVASEQALSAMSDEDAIDLVFAPGFSTAAEVTALSGRGVGMDVVRTATERLGGQVTVASAPGKGTVVRFSLPFTIMMTTVLTVEASGQVFGVPMDAVVETIRIPRDSISSVGSARALVVRNRTLPLIDLNEALRREGKLRTDDASVLIVRVGSDLGGLEVDRLGDRIDVMLKAPEGLLAGVPGIDGTTLMGDGRVLIVLDLQVLFDNEATAKKVPG